MKDYTFESLKGIFEEEIAEKLKKAECGPCKKSSCFMKTALEIIDAGASVDQVSSLAASVYLAAKEAIGPRTRISVVTSDVVNAGLVDAMKMAKEDLEAILASIAKPGRVKKRSLKDKLGALRDLFESTLYLAGKKEPR